MHIPSIFSHLGGPVIIAATFFTLGLVFRAGFRQSLRGCIYAGIGLGSLLLIIEHITKTLSPVLKNLSMGYGSKLTIIDIGWGSVGIAFTWPGFAFVILGLMFVNGFMVLTGLTKTMWTDIWSYWHGQVVGAFVWHETGSVLLGITAAILFLVIGSWIGDFTARKYQEFSGLPSISVPCTITLLGVFAGPFNTLIESIPWIRDINISPQNITKRFGIFGELGVMGALIGVIIGIFAGCDFSSVLNLGINVGLLMVFLSKTVSVLCEGVIPIANAVNEFVQEHFEGKEVYVAVDCAALLGHPSVMASAIILYPLALFIAILLPHNGVIPLASLALIPYWCGAVAPYLKGNVLRIVLFNIIWLVLVLYVATNMAPIHTGTMSALNLGEEMVTTTSFDMGGDLLGFIITKIFILFK